MANKITRLSSRNHSIKYQVGEAGNSARVTLADHERYQLGKDFVLFIKDSGLNQPSAIRSVNQFGEQALMVSIIPELRAPKLRDRFLKIRPAGILDTSSSLVYDPKIEEDIET